MDKKYLNEAALKDLIRRFSTSNDPYAQEDLDTVEKAMLAFLRCNYRFLKNRRFSAAFFSSSA